MIRLLVCGHSIGHPRQAIFLEKIGELGLAKVCVLAPENWYNEKSVDIVKENFESHYLEKVGHSFYTFRLRGLGEHIKKFRPDIIYILEEPHTIFARECKKIAELLQIQYAAFTWENIPERRFGEPFDSIEEEIIKSAAVLIAGNKGAKRRLIERGGDGNKIGICPQNGINCDIFKPMEDVEKDYDLSYVGRMSEEKGVQFIERVAKELNLEMLWVGGRGEYNPSYGNYIGWVNYSQLPECYNKAKVLVRFPYSYRGYSEQFPLTALEAMACEVPVVCSDNGSLKEVHETSPAVMINELDVEELKKKIEWLTGDPEARRELGKEGRKFVMKTYSNEEVTKKLVEILGG